MIVCRLELHRGGDPNDVQHLGTIEISNDLFTSLATRGARGNYSAVIYKKRKLPWKRVKVKDFPRRSYHPWNLIRLILNQAAEQNGGRL